MNKKLSDWASIAEIVGSVAIVISLIYVGVEINQNTREARASNRQSTSERVQDLTLMVATNPLLAEMLTGETDWATVSPVQATQFEYFLIAYLRVSEEAYLQYLDGLLPEASWEARAGITAAFLRSKARPGWWKENESFWNPSFVEWVDRELAGE